MEEIKEYIFEIFDVSNGNKVSIFESKPMTDVFWNFNKDGITVRGKLGEEEVDYFMIPSHLYLYKMSEI